MAMRMPAQHCYLLYPDAHCCSPVRVPTRASQSSQDLENITGGSTTAQIPYLFFLYMYVSGQAIVTSLRLPTPSGTFGDHGSHWATAAASRVVLVLPHLRVRTAPFLQWHTIYTMPGFTSRTTLGLQTARAIFLSFPLVPTTTTTTTTSRLGYRRGTVNIDR